MMVHKKLSLLFIWIVLLVLVENGSAGWFGLTDDKSSGKAFVDDANKAFESGQKMSAEKANQAKRAAQDAADAGKKKAEEAKKKSQELAKEAKKKAKQVGKEGRGFFGGKK